MCFDFELEELRRLDFLLTGFGEVSWEVSCLRAFRRDLLLAGLHLLQARGFRELREQDEFTHLHCLFIFNS